MANISKVTLPGGNDYYIKDSAITFCTCPTGASVAEKVVNPQNNPNFQLRQGAIIGVKFSNTNTASNVTINVNNTGAKSIWYNNAVYASTASGITGYKNRISYFMYDGTYWCLIHNGINNSNRIIKIAISIICSKHIIARKNSTAHIPTKTVTIR